jgi:hypothetical protein
MLTDDGIQMANRNVSRFDWTTYRMGIHYRADNGSHVLIDFNEEGLLNGTYTKKLRTDNLTYYQINVSAYINRGNLSAYMEYTIGQLLNDDYVNFTFRVSTISGFTAFNKTLSFWRAMKNINVDLDDDVDIINGVINNGTIIGRFLNFTTPLWANNTGRFIQVGDKDSSHGIKWFWNDAKERIMYVTPQEGNPNNEVYWLRNTSTKIFDGRSYQLSEFWIDIDPCVISMVGTCYGLRTPRILCNNTGSVQNCTANTDTNRIGIYMEMWYIGLTSCHYTFSQGCYWKIQNSTTYAVLPYRGSSSSELGVSCYNPTYSPCYHDSITEYSTFQLDTTILNISCKLPINRSVYANFSFGIYSLISGTFKLFCNPDTGSPYINQLSPPNNSIVGNPINITCNATDDYPLKNMSIWSNVSGTWTQMVKVFPLPENTYMIQYLLINISNGKNVSWLCNVWDNNAKKNVTANFTFTVNDLVKPNITIVSPPNNSNYTTTSGFNISCLVADNLSAIANVSLWTNFTGSWALNRTVNILSGYWNSDINDIDYWYNITNRTNVTFFNLRTNRGVYAYQCRGCDASGNCNNTARNQTVNIYTCGYPFNPPASWILVRNEICQNESFTVLGDVNFNGYNLTFLNSNMSIDLRTKYVLISPTTFFYLDYPSRFGGG